MASKRKSEDIAINKPAKRNKKDSTDDTDKSNESIKENLISNEEELDADTAQLLPEELLHKFDKNPGQLLIAGMVTWEMTGRQKSKRKCDIRPNLHKFHRFTDEKYRLAVSGSASAHSVLIDMNHKALTFGRNEYGQLGQPLTQIYENPIAVPGLEELKIIGAACGRNHTLFLTDHGTVYACGDNRNGQCGIGKSTSTIMQARRINYAGSPIIKVGCGAEFSVILDIKGNLYTFGLPEYGQLGHDSDGKFLKGKKELFDCETSPKRVGLYIEKDKDGKVTRIDDAHIVDFSCGNNHTVAIDNKMRAYSWGFGGYGRLGHGGVKNELIPRLINYFVNSTKGVQRVFCGSTYSFAISEAAQLFLFGIKTLRGEANVFPKLVYDLAGYNITAIGCGNTSNVISTDDILIAWGPSPTYGELGIGELPKSSAKPTEVNDLKDMQVVQVSMGMTHTMLLCNTDDDEIRKKFNTLPEFVIED